MRSVSIREQGRREVKSSSVSCIMLWKRDIVVPGRGRGPENWRNAFEEYRRRGEKEGSRACEWKRNILFLYLLVSRGSRIFEERNVRYMCKLPFLNIKYMIV